MRMVRELEENKVEEESLWMNDLNKIFNIH